MPRRKQGTRITQPDARKVAGRLCFAAAAEALGGIYGSTSLERALAFTPSARAQRKAQLRAQDSPVPRTKRTLPTGTCKKWLHGHVASDQTLSLIGEVRPDVAKAILRARESDVVKALSATTSDVRFVGQQMRTLSEDAWGNYLGHLALGHCNSMFKSELAVQLLRQGQNGEGTTALVALLGFDRQLPCPKSIASEHRFQNIFELVLENAAKDDPEIAFAQGAITEAWENRSPKLLEEAKPRGFLRKLTETSKVSPGCGSSRPDYANSGRS